MGIDPNVLAELTKREKTFNLEKEKAINSIRKNIGDAIEELRAAEKQMLQEVEIEFNDNPYTTFLKQIKSKKPPSDDDIKKIMDLPMPIDFGPSNDSYLSLLREIKSYKSWKKQSSDSQKMSLYDLIPKNFKSDVTYNSIALTWDKVDCDYYVVEIEYPKQVKYNVKEPQIEISGLESGAEYSIYVSAIIPQNVNSCLRSDLIVIKTDKNFSDCVWKNCPVNIQPSRKYIVDPSNPKVVTHAGSEYNTVIGDIPLLPNKINSWSIKILRSCYNNGSGIYVGVAPIDIDQNANNYDKCGWYFDCSHSTLWSSFPLKYTGKEYGPRKGDYNYIHNGESVTVVMDTKKGELSFILNGVNLNTAFRNIPLDKPLVPCVIMWYGGDSVELITE